MGVEGVRLYHHQALFKEPGGGYTPWHAGQFYWPLARRMRSRPGFPCRWASRDRALSYSVGSQHIVENRELSVSDESERRIALTLKDLPIDETPFELGEVGVHSSRIFTARRRTRRTGCAV